MKANRHLQWFEISGLPGRKTNQKLKGLYGIVTGKGDDKRVFSFYPDGRFLRSEYLRGIKPTFKKIAVPLWAKRMIRVESNGIWIEGLYNPKTKTVIDFRRDEVNINGWIRDLRRSLKDLETIKAIN